MVVGLLFAVNFWVVPKFREVYSSLNMPLGKFNLIALWLSDHWYVVGILLLVVAWAILSGRLDKHARLTEMILVSASILLPIAYWVGLSSPLVGSLSSGP